MASVNRTVWYCAAALVFVTLLCGVASACCCTCENSSECFPVCVSELADRASCDAACVQAECGHVAPCPDPSSGEFCDAGEVSCFDLGLSVGAPALTPWGLMVAASLLAAVGYLALSRSRAKRAR